MLVRNTTPILNVTSIEQSFDWFINLGWEKAWEWGDPIGFGAVRSGYHEIFLCQDGQGGRGKGRNERTFGKWSAEQADKGVWMSIWVDDVDDLHSHCKSNGFEITWEPEDMPWGVREMHIRHPDGHVFRISCPVRPKRTGAQPDFRIRDESPIDERAITAVTDAAFAGSTNEDGTESSIVLELRKTGNLTISLVAESAGEVIGHIGVSPVSLSDGTRGFYGIGPLSVAPDKQGCGVGSALVNAALDRLKQADATACVLEGEHSYYKRFGFKPAAPLELHGSSSKYFQCLYFEAPRPPVTVSFHNSFQHNSQPDPQ
jgi:predicted N-acetyltransferase YhbS